MVMNGVLGRVAFATLPTPPLLLGHNYINSVYIIIMIERTQKGVYICLCVKQK